MTKILAIGMGLCALLCCLVAPVAYGQPPAKDPLETALQSCLDAPSGQTTAGMVECTGTAIRGWDKRLNDVYGQAMKQLDKPSAELLRASQRRWLDFRDAEKAALAGPWRADRGTIIQVETMDAVLSALKERVSELQLYVGDGD